MIFFFNKYKRQIVNSAQAAIQTAYLMRMVIAATKSHQADKLIDTVKEIGKRLVSAQPMGKEIL